jgi:hypothetical protein
MNGNKRVVRASVKQGILYPLAIIFIILLIYFFSFGFTIEELEFVTPYFIIILIAQYFLHFQYEITIIELNEEFLRIRFPLSIYLKDRSYSLNIIERIEIENRPGTRTVPRFFISTKDEKRIKFNYSGHDDDTKSLIEYFQLQGIEIEIIKKH